jgi:hypothetical protein
MHPTLFAMVAAERAVDIARAMERRGYVDIAPPPHLRGTAPLTHAPRRIGPTRALAAAKTALARLVPRPIAAPRRGTSGSDVCCA